MSNSFYKTTWKGLYVLNWVIIILFWWAGSGVSLLNGGSDSLIAVGRLLGLTAGFMLLVQFLFVGRNPLLERFFGLDKLLSIHQLHGRVGLSLLLLHPIFLTWGYSKSSETGFLGQFNSFIYDYPYLNLAFFSLILLLLVVVTSLYIVRSKIKYESWYFVHLLTYLAIVLSFFHQIELGADLILSKVFYYYWIALYIIVFSSHIIFRFIRPIYNLGKYRFYVDRIHRENKDVVSVYIRGRGLESLKIKPGQFMFLRFLTRGLGYQSHPFSVSSIHDGNEIRFTIKEVGDFTKVVSQIKVGTKVLLDGPYGAFTEKSVTKSKVLFIAAGIGITPIRPLVEKVSSQSKDVILLYSNKKAEDVVFKNELESLVSETGLKVTYIFSQDPSYHGERGRLDKEKLLRLVPDIQERDVFICGPISLIDTLVVVITKKLAVPAKQVHFERFALHR